VRQGTTDGGLTDAVVYTSDDAVNWHFATTITGSAGFTPRQVTAGSGGTGRFVVTGRDRQGRAVAYTSTDNGATWAQSHGFGVVPSA
jgi:Neuraminidase (sialidase)